MPDVSASASASASDGVRCMTMRGGTSKGLYFLAADLPTDERERDDLLLRVMGSPDVRQVDGLGGGHPLTSKVAVVSPSDDPDADVDYLFLQVQVDRPVVSSTQACGNIIAGVGPFAIERGLVAAGHDVTRVRIRTRNPSGGRTVATVSTPGGRVRYEGDATISGTPFPGAAIPLESPAPDVPLLPTGAVVDVFDDVEVTCVDAGMPVVLLRAGDLGVAGTEDPAALESDDALRARVEAIRLQAGRAMGLGDVTDDTVPKMTLVAPATAGGTLATRSFIPHRVHTAIGVIAAVSVGAGALLPGSVAAGLVEPGAGPRLRIEHPTGYFDVDVQLDVDLTTATGGALPTVRSSAVVRTARKLADGVVWPRSAV